MAQSDIDASCEGVGERASRGRSARARERRRLHPRAPV